MAVFIDLWPYLFTTELSYAQLFKWGHSNPPVSQPYALYTLTHVYLKHPFPSDDDDRHRTKRQQSKGGKGGSQKGPPPKGQHPNNGQPPKKGQAPPDSDSDSDSDVEPQKGGKKR